MIWAIAVIVLILLGLRFPKFGVAMLLVIVLLAIAVAAYLSNEKSEEEAAKHRVSASQLAMEDMVLAGNGDSYSLVGRVRNNSAHTVTAIKVKVDVQDCDASSRCDTVGEDEQDILGGTIPPGQSRDVDHYFYFSRMRIQGRMQWNYSVTEISASR